MKTIEAETLAAVLVDSMGRKGRNEPSGKALAELYAGLCVNLARIADAIERRNEYQRTGNWDQ